MLPPVQTYRGALRASLEQRAPTAVRNYAAPRLAPTRAQDSSGSSWGDEPNQLSDWAAELETFKATGAVFLSLAFS